ncbi:uncharacterized protein LOC128221165 [Mya arenaria]|uniref:uncharacterized protein LOC128221165 n=1 Tax=Mya arenaria TaxID=6604 RepID=UPI0022E39DFF|nr:uncharacterized protein LOC128221165 [Mya arenaria]
MAENNNRSEQWWRVAYGLVRLRKGLDHFVDRKSRTLYNDVYISGLTSSVCNTCQINKHCHSGANIIPKCYNNTFCKNKFCDSICDRILSTYYPYQKTPIWANTDSTKWSDRNIGYWEIAKCFFNTPGYLDKEGPNTTDGSGLISICLNNKGIRSSISNVLVFEEVRDIRNKISHTADYKLDKQTADEYLEKMIELLNDGRELRNDPFAIVNRRHLQDIKDGKSQCSRKTSTRMELEVCTHNLNNLEEDENYNMFDLNQMSDERIQFTAILVNMFSCLKEEMEKRTALRLMKHILPSAFSYDMDEAQLMCRRRVVDDLLKRIIFSSCETVKERFRQQLAKDKAGSKLAKKLEKCKISNEKITEFRNLQKRRTQQNFEYSQCVRYIALINPLTDVDMIADRLLSAYIINLEEHSNIVHAKAKELKLYMFKTAISRCDKCVLPSLKDICWQLEIRCILCEDEERSERGDEEKSTVEAVLPSPNVNWFSNLGMCIKSTAEGSIILTFDYTDPFALDKCLQECKNGSIVNFVKDIFTDESVLKTIPEGEHNVHVEIKSTGSNGITVILSASFLNRKNMCHQHDEKVPEHDVYICEELEITTDLILQLQAEHVLPENISFELFDNIEGRRNTIHDLLCRCNRSFDHRQFYEIISKQNSHDKKNNNQQTLFTSSCKIIKRGDSLAVEQTLVRRLATKEVTQQTGQLLESKANTRDMQSQIYTDTNRDLDENSNIVEDVRNGIEQFENISKATMITIFKEYGYLGLQKELQKRLNTWKTVKLNIAVIGRAGVGKSTFINTFLKNTKTRTGSVETTNEYKHYHHSELDALIVWNIPGVGSPSFPLNGYLEKIGFDRYDFFLLMLSDRVYGDDLWLMNQIFENKKKAFIIRTKTDQALANRLYDYPGMSEEKVYAKLKQNMVQEFKSANVEQSRIFRICGHDDNLFEFKQLITTIVRETPDLKKSAVTLCVTTVSDEIITAKVAELRKRIYEISLVASLGAAIPIPGAGILVQVSLLYDEAEFYRKQLGTDENTMKEIAKRLNCHIEDLQVRLSMKMHIILRTKTAFAAFLGTLVATEGVESLLKIAIPVIGSIIAAGANYPLCVYSLRKVLSDLEKEARHLNKFLAEWVERESLI